MKYQPIPTYEFAHESHPLIDAPAGSINVGDFIETIWGSKWKVLAVELVTRSGGNPENPNYNALAQPCTLSKTRLIVRLASTEELRLLNRWYPHPRSSQ